MPGDVPSDAHAVRLGDTVGGDQPSPVTQIAQSIHPKSVPHDSGSPAGRAQTEGSEGAGGIGIVQQVAGDAHVVGEDGSRAPLTAGTEIESGARIATGEQSTVAILLSDGSLVWLSENGALTFDEFSFNLDLKDYEFVVSVSHGTFVIVGGFISTVSAEGIIVQTPVAVATLRNGTFGGLVSSKDGENAFTLLKNPDGTVGLLEVANSAGSVLLFLANQTIIVESPTHPMSSPTILPDDDVLALFGGLRALFGEGPLTPASGPQHGGGAGFTPGESVSLVGIDPEGGLEGVPGQFGIFNIAFSPAPGPPPGPPVLRSFADLDVPSSPDPTASPAPAVPDVPAPPPPLPMGTTGNDTLIGGAGNEELIGLAGNDLLDGGPGNDTLDGGPGVDILVWDAIDTTIDGGTGNDTLRVDGGDADLTAFAGTIAGIEVIDLATDTGANTVTLAAQDVLDMSDTDTVTITGDAGDSVEAGTGWTDGGFDGNGNHLYTQDVSGDLATLVLDPDVTPNADILL